MKNIYHDPVQFKILSFSIVCRSWGFIEIHAETTCGKIRGTMRDLAHPAQYFCLLNGETTEQLVEVPADVSVQLVDQLNGKFDTRLHLELRREIERSEAKTKTLLLFGKIFNIEESYLLATTKIPHKLLNSTCNNSVNT